MTPPVLRNGRRMLLPMLLFLMTTGCNSNSDELQSLLQQQQVQQQKLVEESRQLSEASRQLVEADAQTRRELVELQSQWQEDWQSQRQNLNWQRDQLEAERREIARHRYRDPLIATVLMQAATLLVAALPLVWLIYLAGVSREEPAEAPVGELLVQELTAEEPLLLPDPHSQSSLPAESSLDADSPA